MHAHQTHQLFFVILVAIVGVEIQDIGLLGDKTLGYIFFLVDNLPGQF